jgi:hypothetical protein
VSALGRDIAESLDPVLLARRIGWEPDPWQADALRSQAPRVALNVHRQGGKSHVAAMKAIHCAAYQPGSLVLVVSPSQRQSGELFRRISEMWKLMGRPIPAENENTTTLALANGSRIIALPGDPETIRGHAAARLLVIDEASRVSDDLMTAARPMLAVSQGQLLAISTPRGRRGWWFRAVTEPRNGWEVTTHPASENPRLSRAFLEAERADMTDLDFRQEYGCEFVDGAGSLFAADDVLAAVQPALVRFNPEDDTPARLSLVVAS